MTDTEWRKPETLHELFPHIPLGVALRTLVRAQRTPARGYLDEDHTLDGMLYQDRYKGGPMDLLEIEFGVADWAYERAARGAGTVADLLAPEPGWTLPAETRRRFRALESFSLRTSMHSTDLRYDDYYETEVGRNPRLPGEVADYVGVERGQSVELRSRAVGDRIVLSRSDEDVVRLVGLGDHLAKIDGFRITTWLTFTNTGELKW